MRTEDPGRRGGGSDAAVPGHPRGCGVSSPHACCCPVHTEHRLQANTGLTSSSVVPQPSQDTPATTLSQRRPLCRPLPRYTCSQCGTGAPLRAHVCVPRCSVCAPQPGTQKHPGQARGAEPPSLPLPPGSHPLRTPGRPQAALPAAGGPGLSCRRAAAGLFALARTPQWCQKQQNSRKPRKVLKLFSKHFQFGKESLDVILL